MRHKRGHRPQQLYAITQRGNSGQWGVRGHTRSYTYVRPKLLYYWQRQVKQGRMMNQRGRVKRAVVETAIPVDQIGEWERLVGRQQRGNRGNARHPGFQV